LTWDQIVSIEPRLKVLASRARFDANKDIRDKSKLWYSFYKPELSKLVGFQSTNKELQLPIIFEIASWKICELLQY